MRRFTLLLLVALLGGTDRLAAQETVETRDISHNESALGAKRTSRECRERADLAKIAPAEHRSTSNGCV